MRSVPYHPIYLFGRVQGGGTPKADAQNWNGFLPFITPTELAGLDGAPVSASERTVTEIGATQSSVIEAGVLVSCRAPIGSIGTTTTKVAFNQGCKGISIPDPVQAKYVAYALIAARPELENRGNGTTFSEISSNSLGQMRIPAPPLSTQRAIADYLDRETAEIDDMRADLDEMERLLTERRAAVLSTAMEEAAGYSTSPFWNAASLRDKSVSGFGKQVSLDRIESGTGKLLEQTDRNPAEGTVFHRGDILFGKLRPYLAKSWLADRDGTALGDIHVYKPSPSTDPHFFAHYIRSPHFVGLASALSTGTKMPRIEWFKISQFPVPYPSLTEQRRIADKIDRETAEIDSMLSDIKELRDLLAERRAAVISAAVTGQIDIPVSLDDKEEPHA